MFALYLVLIVLSTFSLTIAKDDLSVNRYRGHVLKTNGKFKIVTALEKFYKEPNVDDGATIAQGFWDQNYNTTGWSVLEIKTLDNYSNIDQVYAAGLLEGQLTRGREIKRK